MLSDTFGRRVGTCTPSSVINGYGMFLSFFDAGEPILSGDLIYEISFPGIEGQPAIFHHALSEETPLPVTPGHFLLTHTELLPPVTPPVSFSFRF